MAKTYHRLGQALHEPGQVNLLGDPQDQGSSNAPSTPHAARELQRVSFSAQRCVLKRELDVELIDDYNGNHVANFASKEHGNGGNQHDQNSSSNQRGAEGCSVGDGKTRPPGHRPVQGEPDVSGAALRDGNDHETLARLSVTIKPGQSVT